MKRIRKRQLIEAHRMVIRSTKLDPLAEYEFAQACEKLRKIALEAGQAIAYELKCLLEWAKTIDWDAINENWRKFTNGR